MTSATETNQTVDDRNQAQSETARPSPALRRHWPVALAVVAVVAAGVVVARLLAGWFSPHLYAGTVLQADAPAPALDDLVFADGGDPVDMAAFEDQVVVVFFGYTNCPDVCPASMALAAQARQGLSDDHRDRTRVLMVSVDPERDTPEVLQEYVEFFDPGFDGVSGSEAAIEQVATEYGVFYQIDPTASDADGYLVDHTASLFGIGPDGSLRIVWPPTVTADELQADIDAMLS